MADSGISSPIVQAAMDAGAIQKPAELEELVALLQRRLTRDSVIVEIGCDAGGTLAAWRLLCDRVYGIDQPLGPFSSGRPLAHHGATLIIGNSHYPGTRWQLVRLLDGAPVDFLFIDGDHTYLGVRQDFLMYEALMRPGGLIAFHDICPHDDPLVGVDRFWCTFRGWAGAREIVHPPRTWGGIGVLSHGG